ncbi:hypothetical protein M514_07021 [Trichuris suis]|uniref:Reverse transcriptase domain-containing protein n=1 Tax=Trichuris suis TaxID=68888 RepID=A0A085MTB3_9BILA|nr:hypothetical protein M514_07021 [Trichuris suis]
MYLAQSQKEPQVLMVYGRLAGFGAAKMNRGQYCLEIWNVGGIRRWIQNHDNLSYADDLTLITESEEELRSLFVKVKQEGARSWQLARSFLMHRQRETGRSVRICISGLNGHGSLRLLSSEAMTNLETLDDKGPSSRICGKCHVNRCHDFLEKSPVLGKVKD